MHISYTYTNYTNAYTYTLDIWGFPKMWVPHFNGFENEKILFKWMMTGGSHISGSLHIPMYYQPF